MGAVAIAVNKNGLARTPQHGGQSGNQYVCRGRLEGYAGPAGPLQSLGGVNVVATAATETEATELIFKREGDWQLVTLDLLLEEGSGFNLIPRCKAHPER